MSLPKLRLFIVLATIVTFAAAEDWTVGSKNLMYPRAEYAAANRWAKQKMEVLKPPY